MHARSSSEYHFLPTQRTVIALHHPNFYTVQVKYVLAVQFGHIVLFVIVLQAE